MATPESQVTAQQDNAFVGFQSVEITQKLEGPSLPDPAIHGVVVNAQRLSEILSQLNVGEKVAAEMNAAMADRPAAFLIFSLFPVPRANEIDKRKARNVYGAGKGVDLPFADSDNNRLQITSLVFAQAKKEEGDGGKADETEKDLES